MAGVAWHGTPEQWQGVAEHIMAAGHWQPAFRAVSRQWRRVYDERVPADARPLSRWLWVDDLERAVDEGAHAWCALRVRESDVCSRDLARLVGLVAYVHALDLKLCENVTDATAFGSVHTLDLWYARVKDVSALGGVHTLSLMCCTGVRDVSALGSVHTLDLWHCNYVVDVSALGSVHTLNLSQCDGVTDVSALGSVRTLSLKHCYGVTDVSALGSVHTLDLSYCDDVANVSALANVVDLRLT